MNPRRWMWPSLIVGVPIIIVLFVQLVAKTPLGTPLNEDFANSFLATVAQVLAGILAIVFSLSVLAIEISSDRYTPRLFSYFAEDRATWLTFLSLLLCILISVIAIGIQAVPMYQWGFLVMSCSFAFCLLTLVYYFERTLGLLNPLKLAERIRDEGLQALRRQDRHKAHKTITSLGDVAIKAFERGEVHVAKKYLDALQEMQRAYVAPDSMVLPNEDRDVASAFFGFSIPSPVVDQYYRLFKVTVEKSENLTLYIVSLLSEAIINLMGQGGSKEILKGMLQQHQKFTGVAIEHRDASRFRLVFALKEAVFHQVRIKVANKEYLSACLNTLNQVNKMIIDHQDYELWKEELGCFSNILSVEQACGSLSPDLSELLTGLHRAGAAISREKELLWHTMAWQIRTRITPTNKSVFELGVSEIEQLIPASEQQLQKQAQKVRETIQTLWIITGVYDIFFRVCVYAFYRKEFGYIKELWRHVNPFDADGHWVNANLIHLDVGFLTHQMVTSVTIPWQIEGYHGSEVYIYRYYLIGLAYTLKQTNSDWHPTIPHFTEATLSQGDDYSVAMSRELRAIHTFLVNLPYHTDKVLVQYETVARMSEEWDDVFGGRASEAFEVTRDWLTDTERRQEWAGKAESIIRNLPLDNSRVEAYQEAALEYYQSQSQISQLAMAGNGEEGIPTELRGCCRIKYPDKRDFTLIALGKPEVVGGRVGFEAVAQVVSTEISYAIKMLLEHKTTKPARVKKLTFNKVVKAARKICEAGYKATVLLAPPQQISSAWQDDSDFRVHMVHEDNDRYLELDQSTKLRIVEAAGDYAFILDRNVGDWKAVKPLEIDIIECDKNPLAVRIVARETVIYRVLNPEAVEILKFRSPRESKSKPIPQLLPPP